MIKSINDPKHIALINWLATVRKEQGITVRELAVLLEEDHSTIVKTETNLRKIAPLNITNSV